MKLTPFLLLPFMLFIACDASNSDNADARPQATLDTGGTNLIDGETIEDAEASEQNDATTAQNGDQETEPAPCETGFVLGDNGCQDINECDAEDAPCDTNATCTNTDGSYECACHDGFQGPGNLCFDVDECLAENGGCDVNADCMNNEGGFECACRFGYEGDGQTCVDVDECITENGGCGDATFIQCTNQIGALPTCTDIDECEVDNGGCGENEVCINVQSAPPVCRCKNGYTLNPSGVCVQHSACALVNCGDNSYCEEGICRCFEGFEAGTEGNCVDTDECLTDNGGCGGEDRVLCTNQEGAAPICTDIDECATDNGGCGDNTLCVNQFDAAPTCTCAEGYVFDEDGICVALPACTFVVCGDNSVCVHGICECNRGYEGNAAIGCTDIDECAVDNGGCGDARYMVCQNNEATFPTCLDINECLTENGGCGDATFFNCDNNFSGPPTCTDVDECAFDNGDCGNPTFTRCINLEGSDPACIDIDECAVGLDTCAANATCKNTLEGDGGFTCTCNDGYSGDGTVCTDIDECTADTNTCSKVANCTNILGSYSCACKSGFEGDGETCVDVDECDNESDLCDDNATCTNTFGNYNCACDTGYQGDGITCSDIDECALGTDSCSDNATCANLEGNAGQFACTCNAGFEGDGYTCTDVDECANETDTCSDFATCRNSYGTYECTCLSGYEGDGETCVDIDECATGADQCGQDAMCLNAAGRYTCECMKNGHTLLADDRTCFDVDECATNNGGCDQLCLNIDDGYACLCNNGYELNADGTTCDDIDECALETDNCQGNWVCSNTDGSFECAPCADCGCTEESTEVNIDEVSYRLAACNYDSTKTINDGTCVFAPNPETDCFGNSVFVCGQDIYHGEDANENGILDEGEDENGNGQLDGYTHSTNWVGDQCWIREPSRYLPSVNLVADSDDSEPRYHVYGYDGEDVSVAMTYGNYTNRGVMYNWSAVDVGGVCPDGFAVPTTAQFETLVALFNADANSWPLWGKEEYHGYIEASQFAEKNSAVWHWTQDSADSERAPMLVMSKLSTSRGYYGQVLNRRKDGGGYVRCIAELSPCSLGTHTCDGQAICTAGEGTAYTCTCKDGYAGDGTSCVDIDECATDNGNCGAGSCTNAEGSHSCDCVDGYSFDATAGGCVDDDECTLGTDNCGENVCVNTEGSFACDDVDECADGNFTCNENATCVNTAGSYDCECNEGYLGNGIVCTDTNECAMGTHGCDANAACANNVGSYTCTCNSGYTGDGETCTDVDECTAGTHDCQDGYGCLNIDGGFVCEDIDECAAGTHRCAAEASCRNTDGGYTCDCNDGYVGDGFACNFGSDGSDGAFAPLVDTVLPAGLHQFTTVTIPAGVTVTTNGNGILDLRAKGAVTINGTINLSGGDGGAGLQKDYINNPSGKNGHGGQGGATANPLLAGISGLYCPDPAAGGFGNQGDTGIGGTCDQNRGGKYGGGSGAGASHAGAGGGGLAGGGGGGSRLYSGGDGATYSVWNNGGEGGESGPADLDRFGLPTPGKGGIGPGAYAGDDGPYPTVGSCVVDTSECAEDDVTESPVYGLVDTYSCNGTGAFWSYDQLTPVPGCIDNENNSSCAEPGSDEYTAELAGCDAMSGQLCYCMQYEWIVPQPPSTDDVAFEWVTQYECQADGFWSTDGTTPIPGCSSAESTLGCLLQSDPGFTTEQQACLDGDANCQCLVRSEVENPTAADVGLRYHCEAGGFWSTDGVNPISGCTFDQANSSCLPSSDPGFTAEQEACENGQNDCECLVWSEAQPASTESEARQRCIAGFGNTFWSLDGVNPVDGCVSDTESASCLSTDDPEYTAEQAACENGEADCACMQIQRLFATCEITWVKQFSCTGYWGDESANPVNGCTTDMDVQSACDYDNPTPELDACGRVGGGCSCWTYRASERRGILAPGTFHESWIQVCAEGTNEHYYEAVEIEPSGYTARVVVPAVPESVRAGEVTTTSLREGTVNTSSIQRPVPGEEVEVPDPYWQLTNGTIVQTFSEQIVDYDYTRNCEVTTVVATEPGASGGGGGIGFYAADRDPSMADSFYPGSGGGSGGSGTDLTRFAAGGGGGGGGGGALRVTSEVSIEVSGRVLANGGNGGYATSNGGGGGGGSGGAIWLESPVMNISGDVQARGGYAGASCVTTTASDEEKWLTSYTGGLGRIRITATKESCTLTGNFMPALADDCNDAAQTERVYITTY